MASELSPDRDAVIEQLVAGGIFSARHEALNHAVDLLREEAETVAAVREGLESMQRGEGIPLEEAARELRARHQIAEDA